MTYPMGKFKLENHEAWNIAKKRSFGSIITFCDSRGFFCSHIPFLCCDYNGKRVIEFHLAKNNPMIIPLSEGVHCLLVCHAGDAYIRPQWYRLKDQVPTWIYIAVEIRAKSVTLAHSEDERRYLEEITKRFETSVEEPFSLDDLPPEKIVAMQRAIQCFRLDVTSISGHKKLSQNKPIKAIDSMLSELKNNELTFGVPLFTEIKKYL